MAGQQPKYYRPYDSGDESDSDLTTSSWYSSGTEDQSLPPPIGPNGVPDFQQFASQLVLQKAAGPPISSIQQDLAFGQDLLGKQTNYSEFIPIPLVDNSDPEAGKFDNALGTNTTLTMIDSRFRDRQVYPQPTLCTLRLPRVYRNITQIQLVEMKLLTSFYFFRNSKGNTDISILEQGRSSLYNGVLKPTIVKSFIRTGSYDINGLINELKIQLNYVPLFYDFVNGFNDFVNIFRTNGDFSVNFNEPGDYWYNNTTNQFVANPTKLQITLSFWPSRYAKQTSYTSNQLLMAYYYPVLKEVLTDEDYPDYINLQAGIGVVPSITTTTQVRERILYNFLGLNDPVVLAVIKANRSRLDTYRLNHTFRYYLINKYVPGINSQSQIVYFTTPSLNTSLVNLLNLQQAKFFNRALTLCNLTLAQYNQIQSNVDRSLAVLNGMYAYEQQQFLTYFAVPWGQYTMPYYATLDWPIYLRNGINGTGLPTNDAESIDAGIVSASNNIFNNFNSNAPVYWPKLSNLQQSTISVINLSTPTYNFNHPYSLSQSNVLLNQDLIDPTTGYFYTEYLSGTANAVCPITAGQYTVFKFNSPVRQTLQLETTVRPPPYRLIKYNQSNFGSTINDYFDLSYSFTLPLYSTAQSTIYTASFDNLPTSNLNQVPGWAASNVSSTNVNYSWNMSYATATSKYANSLRLDVTEYNRALYFQFFSPLVSTPQITNRSSNSNYTYTMNLATTFYADTATTLGSAQANMQLFVYHDRAAFQADVLCNRNENPRFYKYSQTILTGTQSNVFSFTTYENQQYYIILRPDSTNFNTMYLRVTPYISTTVTTQTKSVTGINPATDLFTPQFSTLIVTNFNYAQVYDSNFIRLPTDSNLWPPDPEILTTAYDLATFRYPIGYDASNVTTDYTAYVPFYQNCNTGSFVPSYNLGIDPITQYLFQSNSPYDSTLQDFLYPEAENYLFTPGLVDTYTPDAVDVRQEAIVHYYSLNYLPESDSNVPLTQVTNTDAQQPYTVSTTQSTPIPGYRYGTNCNIQLSKGVMGFSFIPAEGVWDIQRIMFRSAINDSNNDPNSNIAYLGVYTYGDILSSKTSQLTLSTALVVLSNSAHVTYDSNFTQDTYGFDINGGTYYEFQKDSSFSSYCNQPILGYDQTPGTMSDQPESMYVAIAFSQYDTAITIKALSGSTIPYPLYNTVVVSTCYLDGTKAYISSQGVLVPGSVGQSNWPWASSFSTLYAPPNGFDKTQSQYTLSYPIGTSVVPYKIGLSTVTDTNFLQTWTTPLTPSRVIGTVSNYFLLQDTQYNIYYRDPLDDNRDLTTPTYILSADDVYPSYTGTSLVSISGNSQYFYFLGLNAGTSNFSIQLRRFDPAVGNVELYDLDESFKIPFGGTVRSFTINDLEQLAICYQLPTQTRFYYNLLASTSMISSIVSGSSNAVHAMDPTTSTLYWIPLDSTTNTGTTLRQWELNASNSFPGTLYTTSGPLTNFNQLAVNSKTLVAQANDRIFLTINSGANSSNLYISQIWSTGPNQISFAQVSNQLTTATGGPYQIASMTGGYAASLWLTATGQSNIWANRNSDTDVEGLIGSAWQIFYPFQRIILTQLSNQYNAIFDTNFVNYPEYPHTASFYYSNQAQLTSDIGTKWGLESSIRFVTSDPDMSGYYFNSFITVCPLLPSSNTSTQCIAIRGFTPTEQSETLVRFILPNKYDFGYVTSLQLISEISSLSNSSLQYTNGYSYALSNFNFQFAQSNSYFGQDLIPDFAGSNYNSCNFQQFASNLSTVYSGFLSNSAIINGINDFVQSNMLYFISTQMQYILPPQVLTRLDYTAPIPFSILWFSSLLPQYRDLLEDWGLGYNLGFAKVDTTYSTYHEAESFYKILEDYIYLRMNPEYPLNTLDTTAKENFKITRDSTGFVNTFHGKLLLGNFNTYSRSFVSNPVRLNPPIGRLDQMYFQWVDFTGTQIDNFNCDWSASLNITESKQINTVSQAPLPPINRTKK
jgi:hypothetical protein